MVALYETQYQNPLSKFVFTIQNRILSDIVCFTHNHCGISFEAPRVTILSSMTLQKTSLLFPTLKEFINYVIESGIVQVPINKFCSFVNYVIL